MGLHDLFLGAYLNNVLIFPVGLLLISQTQIGEVGVSCAIFCFKAPSRRTIVVTCLRLCQVKIYKFGHIMCNSWLHGTAVEFTVGCRKKNLKWHNLPQPWGKLCHHKGQVVPMCYVKKSLCKRSESKR